MYKAHETWKPIPRKLGYKSFYQISNLGRVRSRGHVSLNGRYYPRHIHKVSYSKRGYPRVRLHKAKGNRAVAVDIHRLVAKSFLPNPKHYKYVIHRNGNLFDNQIVNLKWSKIKPHHTNRGVVKRYSNSKKVLIPFKLEPINKIFPSLLSAARYIHKRSPTRTLKQCYGAVERLAHGKTALAYNQYYGHLAVTKKGRCN